MPFPNEHAARIKSPSGFEKFRRNNNAGGSGVDFLFGITANGKTEVQSIRFKTDNFTEAQARAWLKDHDRTALIFEAASGSDNAESKLSDWFAVAKTGKFPQGDLTADTFDQVVKNFDASNHEPPITVGHIRDNHNDKPAVGWIDGVKRTGDYLFVKGRQIWEKFDGLVREGRFKKRSIGIRHGDNGAYLHHLAFLGAMPPAVKGLPDLYDGNYSGEALDTQADDYKFDDEINPNPNHNHKGDKMEYSEAQIKDMKENAAREAVDAEKEKIKSDAEKDFNEKLEKEKTDAAKAERDKVEKEFSDKADGDKAIAEHNRKVDEFCDAEIKAGHITPAMLKAGLKPLLYSMAKPADLEYSDKDKDGKETTVKTNDLDILKNVIKAYSAAPTEGIEHVEGDGKNGDYAAEQKRAKEIVAEGKKNGTEITFGEALKEARSELKSTKE